MYHLSPSDGPIVESGPERFARVGDPLSLKCGNISSNPQPTVTSWRDNMGVQVMPPRFSINGLYLNFASTRLEDTGIWQCFFTVTGNDVLIPEIGTVSSFTVGQGMVANSLTVVGNKNV